VILYGNGCFRYLNETMQGREPPPEFWANEQAAIDSVAFWSKRQNIERRVKLFTAFDLVKLVTPLKLQVDSNWGLEQ